MKLVELIKKITKEDVFLFVIALGLATLAAYIMWPF